MNPFQILRKEDPDKYMNIKPLQSTVSLRLPVSTTILSSLDNNNDVLEIIFNMSLNNIEKITGKDIHNSFHIGAYPEKLNLENPNSSFFKFQGTKLKLSENDTLFQLCIRYVIPTTYKMWTYLSNLKDTHKIIELKLDEKGFLYCPEILDELRKCEPDFKLVPEIDDIVSDINAVNEAPKIKPEIDIREIVYGKPEKQELKLKPVRISHTIALTTVSEPIYRKNGSLEKTNTFIRADFSSTERYNGYEVYGDITPSPVGYELLFSKLAPLMLHESSTCLTMVLDNKMMNVLGNPTISQLENVLNSYARKDSRYNNSVLQTEGKGKVNFIYREIDSTNKFTDADNYYEEIDGIILPNKEGQNEVPNMLDIFHKILLDS